MQLKPCCTLCISSLGSLYSTHLALPPLALTLEWSFEAKQSISQLNLSLAQQEIGHISALKAYDGVAVLGVNHQVISGLTLGIK